MFKSGNLCTVDAQIFLFLFSLYVTCMHIGFVTNGVLAIRRIFSLFDMLTNTKFSNCSVLKIGVVQQ